MRTTARPYTSAWGWTVLTPDALMVVSFMAVLAGVYLGLLWLIDNIVQWLWDNGWFWVTAVPVATAIWLSNIW